MRPRLMSLDRETPPSENWTRAWIRVHSDSLTDDFNPGLCRKWCIVRPPRELDAVWELVKEAMQSSKLLAAKVSTAAQATRFGTHLICVYTWDWLDETAMMAAPD